MIDLTLKAIHLIQLKMNCFLNKVKILIYNISKVL